MNYYNEFDPKAAAWLRELIAQGLIPAGYVDTRSITEIQPHELTRYTQCHFFAGIGGWSLALQLAGWPSTRPVWTGSCPCQPFSAAGSQDGTADERHLWPVFFRLIDRCRPPIVFGEQVASALVVGKVGGGHKEADGPVWLDGVSADLESAGYATGAAVLGAHSVGSPHIRQRLYWMADANGKQAHATDESRLHTESCGSGLACGMAHADGRESGSGGLQPSGQLGQQPEDGGAGTMADTGSAGLQGRERERSAGTPGPSSGCAGKCCSTSGMADTQSGGQRIDRSASRESGHVDQCGEAGRLGDSFQSRLEGQPRNGDHRDEPGRDGTEPHGPATETGGAWDSFDLLPCTDGKARRVESPSFEMAYGLPKVMGLCGYQGIPSLEEEIKSYATTEKTGAREALSALWSALSSQTIRGDIGGLHSVYSPPILLSFMRELSLQGWDFTESILRASEETQEALMRSLWWKKVAPCSPRQRGLERQHTDESPNPLCVLSSILARHAQAAWGEAVETNASDCYPLTHGAPARMVRLRGYGNAIVPQTAALFVSAYLDTQ